MKSYFFTTMVIFLSFGNAYAGCWYAGQEYPVGAVVNGYICQPDGTWGR